MCSRNAPHRGEAEPGPAGSGGEEWMKDSNEICFANAASVVRNFNDCLVFKF